MRYILTIFMMSFMFLSCGDKTVKEYGLKVVATYPHDTDAYTQGLFFHDGQLYESTGVKGKSTFRVVDHETGNVRKKLDFDRKYFVEGSVIFNDNLYILTW